MANEPTKEPCWWCKGSGEVQHVIPSWTIAVPIRFFTTVCPRCHGTGQVVSRPADAGRAAIDSERGER